MENCVESCSKWERILQGTERLKQFHLFLESKVSQYVPQNYPQSFSFPRKTIFALPPLHSSELNLPAQQNKSSVLLLNWFLTFDDGGNAFTFSGDSQKILFKAIRNISMRLPGVPPEWMPVINGVSQMEEIFLNDLWNRMALNSLTFHLLHAVIGEAIRGWLLNGGLSWAIRSCLWNPLTQ